jgi:hypothetical protein
MSRKPGRWGLLAAVLMAATTHAQIGGAGGGGQGGGLGGGNLTGGGGGAVGGVYIDADGVLRSRDKASGDKLAKSVKQAGAAGEFRTVSLKRMLAEARESLAAGKRIPERVRTFDGLVRIRFLLVDPSGDLLLAGPAESVSAGDSARPIGSETGRPTLRLEDFVVALRLAAEGKPAFGCSLDMPPDGIANMQRVAKETGAIQPSQVKNMTRKMADAVGPQRVRVIGCPDDTPFALALLEADYVMKRIALGVEAAPVKGVRSHISMMKATDSAYSRYWFQAKAPKLVAAEDGSGYEFPGTSMMVLASDQPGRNGHGASETAAAFADGLTEKFDELAERIPSWADLVNLTDLAVVARLIREDRLEEKTGVDTAWLLDPKAFPVPKIPVPKTAATVANASGGGRAVRIALGGVDVNVRALTSPDHRESIAGAELSRRKQSAAKAEKGSRGAGSAASVRRP